MTCRFSTAQRATSSGCNKISTCTSSTCSTRTTLRRSWVRCGPSVFLRIELNILSRFPKARPSPAPRNVLRFHRGQAVPVGGLANTVCSCRHEYRNSLLMRSCGRSFYPAPCQPRCFSTHAPTHTSSCSYTTISAMLYSTERSRAHSLVPRARLRLRLPLPPIHPFLQPTSLYARFSRGQRKPHYACMRERFTTRKEGQGPAAGTGLRASGINSVSLDQL